ncbi:MAG: phosphatidate cytidylyltransferase [Candidatus Cloacimonetes bacterium]|nr:phosphatidate cytidylyltransferase [Candidatus Cloacimonadota bacterium]
MIVLKRIIVAVIFIPLILVALLRGDIPLMIMLSIFTVVGLYELRQLFKQKYGVIPCCVIPLGLIFLWLVLFFGQEGIIISFLAILLIIAAYDIFANRIEGATNRLALATFAIVYQPLLYSFVYRLRGLENGEYLVISLIILIWTTDTFAYFLGMAFGKHRGLLKASPKKSIEGFIFGIIFAFVGAYILHLLFREFVTMRIMFLAAISAGIFGQFGDLLESLIKRDVGVKDSSNIIPGHGGVLDRFDSFVIAAPAFYILYSIFV